MVPNNTETATPEDPDVPVPEEEVEGESAESSSNEPRGLRVLFLSSDTGGGHRASAESLAKQFQILYPGTTYDLLDIVEKDGVPPYNSLVSSYKHLSAHPTQWKIIYGFSNSRAFEVMADVHLKLMCERAVRRRIKSYHPDVVVSVHPLMTNVPALSCTKISRESGKHLPMFTVVTDLGSAHRLWFGSGVEKVFVGSEQVRKLARTRGKVPENKLELVGLPIRHDFAVQAEKLADRHSPEGKAYQVNVRSDLGLPFLNRKTILLMGGGEGVGSLSSIVDSLYVELVTQGIDALLLVVCGRNKKLQTSLEQRDWSEVLHSFQSKKERRKKGVSLTSFSYCGRAAAAAAASETGCIESSVVTSSLRKILSTGNLTTKSETLCLPVSDSADSVGNPYSAAYVETEEGTVWQEALEEAGDQAEEAGDQADPPAETPSVSLRTSGEADEAPIAQNNSAIEEGCRVPGSVEVVSLGFVERMAEYMVAADVLVSKAGPGTIMEAAALSLPVMLTSFLPGQEEGNVGYVVDGGFGAFCRDSDPAGIAEELCMWLWDKDKLASMSRAAKQKGAPYAARDIAKAIGDSTLKWREKNEKNAKPAAGKQ